MNPNYSITRRSRSSADNRPQENGLMYIRIGDTYEGNPQFQVATDYDKEQGERLYSEQDIDEIVSELTREMNDEKNFYRETYGKEVSSKLAENLKKK